MMSVTITVMIIEIIRMVMIMIKMADHSTMLHYSAADYLEDDHHGDYGYDQDHHDSEQVKGWG